MVVVSSTQLALLYDSNRMMYVGKALKNEICSFVKPTCDVYTFDIMNIQTQTNTSDCGLFSIACATELVEGHDPVVCHWDQAKMRPHLMKCLVEGKMVRFPCSKQRRIGLGQRVRKSEKEQLYCVCRLPNDKVRAMIECTSCRNWFHNGCVGLESTDVSELRWRCMKCSQALTFLVFSHCSSFILSGIITKIAIIHNHLHNIIIYITSTIRVI